MEVMENTQQQATDGQASTNAATGEGQQSSPTTTTQAATSTQGQTTPSVQTPYTPNYKFKVINEEKEFDEFVRPLIKDAETEKKIRDLYTKAHGLEPLKSRLNSELDTTRNSYKEVNEKYTNISRSLGELSHYVKQENFDAFFKALQIPEQKVYQWVNRKIQERELPAEQQAEMNRRRQTDEHLFKIQQENEDLKRQFESTTVRQNEMHLEQTLGSPEFSEVARNFDSSVGRPGAFKMEIIKRGALLEQSTGRTLPVNEVIADFMGMYGRFVSPTQNNPMNQTGAQTNVQPGQRPPTIPHVQSQGSAPVKKVPRSIEELRNMAAQ